MDDSGGIRVGSIQFNIRPYAGTNLMFGGTATGAQFNLLSNSTLVAYYPPAAWPGNSPGVVTSGGRYQGAADACIGGASGCNATNTPAGVGTAGSVVLAANSSPYGGSITILPGGTGIGGTYGAPSRPIFTLSVLGSRPSPS